MPLQSSRLPAARNGSALLVILFLLGVMGCDPTVDSFQENHLHYSIFGYLNAAADTQFVRVEDLRDGLLDGAPATLNVDVTLTHRSTGRVISLRDSLFPHPDRHNYYTTEDIEPAAAYRLRVQGPNGAESQVQTAVPDTFPPPFISVGMRDCFPNCPRVGPPDCDDPGDVGNRFTILLVEGIERLVAVKALYYMEEPRGVWSYGHLADTVRTGNGMIRLTVNYARDWCKLPTPHGGVPKMQKRIEIVVAAGSPNWPDFLGMDLETEMLPGVASNVEGGVGFLGGVVTDTVVVYPP